MEALDALDSAPTYGTFTELFDASAEDLYRYIHRRCRDHGLAEDITQDVFMTAVRGHHPGEISVGWLKRAARNRLIDVLRRQATYERKLRLVGVNDEEEIDVTDRLRVEAALGEVSVEHRLVLSLHYLDGMTVGAIAADMGRSHKTVEALITRARRQLRAVLGELDG